MVQWCRKRIKAIQRIKQFKIIKAINKQRNEQTQRYIFIHNKSNITTNKTTQEIHNAKKYMNKLFVYKQK